MSPTLAIAVACSALHLHGSHLAWQLLSPNRTHAIPLPRCRLELDLPITHTLTNVACTSGGSLNTNPSLNLDPWWRAPQPCPRSCCDLHRTYSAWLGLGLGIEEVGLGLGLGCDLHCTYSRIWDRARYNPAFDEVLLVRIEKESDVRVRVAVRVQVPSGDERWLG